MIHLLTSNYSASINKIIMQTQNISLAKYLAIIIYDFIIVIGVLLLAISLLFLLLLACDVATPSPDNLWFRGYLFFVIFSYYHLCWSYDNKGQTIGMKAWSVVLENQNSHPVAQKISLTQTFLRIVGGWISFLAFGLGHACLYFNKENKTLPDYLSNSQLKNLS